MHAPVVLITIHVDRSIWADAIKAGHERVFILEDDISLSANLSATMDLVHANLPQDWEFLYGGYCLEQLEASPDLPDYLKIVRHAPCMHGYGVNGVAVLQRLLDLTSSLLQPVDLPIGASLRQNGLKAYAVVPPIAQQIGGASLIHVVGSCRCAQSFEDWS